MTLQSRSKNTKNVYVSFEQNQAGWLHKNQQKQTHYTTTTTYAHVSSTQEESERKKTMADSYCSVTEPVHHGSISPCEGADPEGKKEGAGN